MSEEYKLVFDCSTGVESYIPLTPEEIAQKEIDRIEYEARVAAEKAAQDAAIAARESARAKLAALGLTEEEVAALIK